ncbi:MAG: hypothetical protein QXU18_10995 [Thermoplasmatales archaeon]
MTQTQFRVSEYNQERVRTFLKSLNPDAYLSKRLTYERRAYTFDEALTEILNRLEDCIKSKAQDGEI